MTDHSEKWTRVSRERPCPICGKPDNCCVSRDGGAVWCGRVSEGSIRENAGGQYLHRLNDQPWRMPLPPPPPSPVRPSAPTRDFAAMGKQFAAHAEARREELATRLGVNRDTLRDLGVGWSEADRVWTIPERDGEGAVIGLSTRHLNGDKKRATGSKAGLTYLERWDAGHGPILLVEGGSDTAALLSIGLNVVGRPSNCGGVAHLITLLADIPDSRPIIVVGERDQKEDGRWPGREGAIRTAQRLTDELERPVDWGFPPDDAKDARDWLQKMPRLPSDRLAALFLDGLDTTRIEPPPRIQPPALDGPVINIRDWRDWMYRVRVDAMNQSGFYLDESSTGAGKSRVDLDVLTHFWIGAAVA